MSSNAKYFITVNNLFNIHKIVEFYLILFRVFLSSKVSATIQYGNYGVVFLAYILRSKKIVHKKLP